MAGIYIHIPFCKKLCFYCDFYHTVSSGDNSAFIEALLKEASLRKDYLETETVSTIYFGGGTPSVFSIEELDTILNQIFRLFRVVENCEITIELNPDDINPVYLAGLKKLNINRISLGIQAWQDSYLKKLNRRHDSAQAAIALKETFRAGFENVTIDLIYGIPGMTIQEWTSNLDYSFSFDIKHLSAYHLTIEPGTVFGKMQEKGLIAEIDEEESNSLFNILIEKAESAGFVQITGNRSVTLVLVHRLIHLTDIHASGILVIQKAILNLLIQGNHFLKEKNLIQKPVLMNIL
jgi:oxygen-independent coproporphyrinogen-3 oxidase